ncbi:fatty acid desaturase [Tardiphaga sp. 804_B3_N1_9]|jgi:fatty acid desaturase|uniref:fatty acid desaturase n=1 Tax=Tardiphaga TaxID=1395974 RepID=UPI0015868B70|nr:fatty acid desaturase [Tardiphaga robiniae]NUU40450.1 fatty acid desaturase [Tardiphaga robiniae]
MTMDAVGHGKIETRALTPAQLKDLSVRANLPGLIRSISHYALIALVGTLIWQVATRYGMVWTTPLIVIQGYLIAFLFMAVHEAAHKTVFTSRRLNEALGHVSSLMIVLPYEHYALFHWDHHRFTQDPDRDPELVTATIPSSDTRLAIAYTGIVQLTNRIRLLVRRAVTGQAVAPWIPESKQGMVVREARIYALVYLALLIASIAFSSTMLLWCWLVPLYVGQLFLRPYLYAEHTGCERTRSAYENTRTTYTDRLTKWFTWNMPFHVEHHAYPSVPFHALPKLNAIIDERIAHRGQGYRAVTRETWRWFRRARQGGI